MAKQSVYCNLKQASEQLGIPLSHLKVIKQLYPEGFQRNNNVLADKVAQYYSENRATIISHLDQSIDSLKKEFQAGRNILQKIEIQEKQHELISIKELELFLRTLGLGLSGLLKAKLVNELPQRIDRVESSQRESMCKDIYNEISAKLQEDVDKWLDETINSKLEDTPNEELHP